MLESNQILHSLVKYFTILHILTFIICLHCPSNLPFLNVITFSKGFKWRSASPKDMPKTQIPYWYALALISIQFSSILFTTITEFCSKLFPKLDYTALPKQPIISILYNTKHSIKEIRGSLNIDKVQRRKNVLGIS